MPVYCLQFRKTAYDREIGEFIKYTKIKKGDKIAQFRIMEIQPSIEFEEVERKENNLLW